MKLLPLSLVSLAAATPLGSLEERQSTTLCGQYSYWSGNGYEVLNNLWGKDAATSGSQCTYVDGSSSSGVKYHTTWTWNGGENNVKSFAWAQKTLTKGRKISSINSMQTSASWSYSTSNIRADVAYDIFTAADPNHSTSSGDYELMIWLAKYGNIQPIGSSTGSVSVAGRTWDLWVGYNGAMKVFSFVAPSPVNSFSANVKDFFNYLQQKQNYPASNQNLITFQIGSEPFTGGPATFTVSNWSANIS